MSRQQLEYIAYTDGACSGNPGPGGWGALLIAQNPQQEILRSRELCGGAAQTTNNKMELMAAIMALESLKRSTAITIFTDSIYVKNGITNWIKNWKVNHWRAANKKPVANSALWQRLDNVCGAHQVTWQWVKGHADNAGNIRADALARQGMKPFQGR